MYQDYAENPEVDLDTALETIVFLILSAETNRFIGPDEAVARPWLVDTPKESSQDLPADFEVDLLPGHTE